MSPLVVAIGVLILFFLGYRFYSKYLADKVYRLDPRFRTPAHEFQDGVDYVPTNKFVLWGHHFSSVAGAAPIVGPAIAMIWGWGPALLWVTLGTIFFAGMHDFGTLWASVRNRGESIGSITRTVIGSRAKNLFLLIIFFLLVLVNAVFAVTIANLFDAFPSSVLPYWLQVPVAIAVGILVYKRGAGLFWPSIIALILLFAFIFAGAAAPVELPKEIGGISSTAWWVLIMLIYGAIASRLPVWLLLQPRDYINSHMLFLGLIIYIWDCSPEIRTLSLPHSGRRRRMRRRCCRCCSSRLLAGLSPVSTVWSDPGPAPSKLTRKRMPALSVISGRWGKACWPSRPSWPPRRVLPPLTPGMSTTPLGHRPAAAERPPL